MNYMKQLVFLLAMVCTALLGKTQVTVTGNANATPAMAATYTSLANAITALNTVTNISGPIIITLNAGNPQTAPAGGYAINFTAATTNVGSRTVTITGNNNTITASAALTSGVLTDAIFKIVGPNFVTIQNFIMQENPANINTTPATNNMTEWGVALLCSSTTNGAQNNTIRNNTISLNKAYSNTFGIYSNARHSASNVITFADASSVNGANSNNIIQGNSISNVNTGMAFTGSSNAGFMDLGNDIGGSDLSTANTISNWGGLTAASAFVGIASGCHGIFINNQKNENVSFNTITSATLTGTPVDTRGIYKTYNTVPTGTFTSSVTNNVITVNHNFASGVLEGILSEGMTTTVTGATIHINNNRFQNMAVMAAASSTELIGISNTSSCGTLNINDNIFRGNTSTATTAGFTAISNASFTATAANINNNKIGDASGNAISFSAAAFSGVVRGINNSTGAGTAATLSISGNNFQGFLQSTASAAVYVFIECLRQGNVAPSVTGINSNTFTNLSINSSGSVTFIRRTGPMSLNVGITDNCNDNRIVTAFAKPVAGGTVTLYDCVSPSDGGINNVMNQLRNNFSNITLTGATIMAGWNNSSGTANGPRKISVIMFSATGLVEPEPFG